MMAAGRVGVRGGCGRVKQ